MIYYKISNADGKQWIMPSKNMSIGMQLYQPSAWKGKLLKDWFPLVSKFDGLGLVKKALHITACDCPVSDSLNSKLCQLFGKEVLEYSVFNGTPCAHQKATIQIYSGNDILGYCKITDKAELIEIFKKEQSFLQWMSEKKVEGVPQCLCCEEVGQGRWIFVQTTTKSKNSKLRHELGDKELNFLADMTNKTSVILAFDETDQYSWMKSLSCQLNAFSDSDAQTVGKAIEKINNYYATLTQSVFSAYHSDFTPWNMFEEKGKIFVFDWEYAGRTYMPYLDLIHHLVQTSVFEGKLEAEGIFDVLFHQKAELLNKYFEDSKMAVLIYLIDIIAKYTSRDADQETDDTRMLKATRIKLISLILKEYTD